MVHWFGVFIFLISSSLMAGGLCIYSAGKKGRPIFEKQVTKVPVSFAESLPQGLSFTGKVATLDKHILLYELAGRAPINIKLDKLEVRPMDERVWQLDVQHHINHKKFRSFWTKNTSLLAEGILWQPDSFLAELILGISFDPHHDSVSEASLIYNGRDPVGVIVSYHSSLGPSTEVTYGIFPPYQGKGYLAKVLPAYLKNLRERYPDRWIESKVEPDNKASLKVALESGFEIDEAAISANVFNLVYPW